MSVKPPSKPNTSEAMRRLIDEIRREIPLDRTNPENCPDQCSGCSIKLLEYLSDEIESWEYRLAQNETPNFRDLQRLEKSGRKIYRLLAKNGLISGERG